MFEHKSQPLATKATFLVRMVGSLGLTAVIVLISLLIGMWGYHHFETGMTWVDAFANASMILSGMGPLGNLEQDAAKIFAGVYALYSGLVLIAVTGVVLAPVVHRILHRIHVDSEDSQRN